MTVEQARFIPKEPPVKLTPEGEEAEEKRAGDGGTEEAKEEKEKRVEKEERKEDVVGTPAKEERRVTTLDPLPAAAVRKVGRV